MKLKGLYDSQMFFLAVSLCIQVFLAAGLIYLSNKNANIIDLDVIDKFINEEKLNSGNESNQRLLKIAHISREIGIQAEKLLNQQNDVMRNASKLLLLSIVLQVILLISIIKTKRKDNLRINSDAQ